MRMTLTHDTAGGTVRLVIEFPDTAIPEKAADVAWTAIDRALTELRNTTPETGATTP